MVLSKVMQYVTFAKKWAYNTNVDAALILAVIHQESGGNPCVTRKESSYKALYGDSDKIQSIHRITALPVDKICTSYGLMQLMLPTAWGYINSKYQDEYVIEHLLDPYNNIRYGAAHLSTLIKKCNGDIWQAVQRYNGVSSQYANNVIALTKEYKEAIGHGN